MRVLRVALLSIGLVGLLMAALMAMPDPETAQALPPRPTQPAINAPTHIMGGFITLTTVGATNETWTAIQWQDANGDWHLVDGWQGTPNSDNEVHWYVGPENLGSGPFRWQVYDVPNGEILATSDSFDLPTQAGETEAIIVTVP